MKTFQLSIIAASLLFITGVAQAVDLEDLDVTIHVVENDDANMSHELNMPGHESADDAQNHDRDSVDNEDSDHQNEIDEQHSEHEELHDDINEQHDDVDEQHNDIDEQHNDLDEAHDNPPAEMM